MPAEEQESRRLLEHVYRELDLTKGSLVKASSSPAHATPEDWQNVGDWLLLADRVKADSVFFVNNDPVLVFSALPANTSERDILSTYRRTWSLARPKCLFLAVGSELRVYALSQPPVAPTAGDRLLEPLEIVSRAADVGEALARFRRDRLETGAAFQDAGFADGSGTADVQLLRDVRTATDALVASGLDPLIAHALIERAILVRYLEDRGVLTEDYFTDLARGRRHWLNTLSNSTVPEFGPSSCFVRCLGDKGLSYALFDQLGRDFNGDLFVSEGREREIVSAEHLETLCKLLTATTSAAQDPLFLWAYDFSVVPTNLVSTMYELFYRQEVDGEASSTYYTPPQVVEFMLADVLGPEILDRAPTVCDPACGSGIFLVEAYRRIVRHEAARRGHRLSTDRLRKLLTERLAGCDIDESAVRLAAFSLYVAFLNYQSPQDIRRAGPLPPLIFRPGVGRAPLVIADAFAARGGEEPDPSDDDHALLPWPETGFDVVVGNPPWTEPRSRDASLGEQWAKRRGLHVGDRSPSQLFLWRSLDLLAEDGIAALLISAKAMLNTRTTSLAFRSQWLTRARVERVMNFSAVRRDFFEQGIAPFMYLRFSRMKEASNGAVVYETARPVPPARRGSPALARLDRRVVSQAALRSRDYLWKTYSAGGHRDDALLSRLGLEDRLRSVVGNSPRSQYGFQRAKPSERAAHAPSPALAELESLRTFRFWGQLRHDWLEPIPDYVKFAPDDRLYHGRRLLVRRGVTTRFGPEARLETRPLAFRHTIYGISLQHLPAWQAKVILGTVLSQLGRYWLYMVSGSWGTWRDEVRSEELLDLPIRFESASAPTTKRIVAAVDALRHAAPSSEELLSTRARYRLEDVLHELDVAISDLFELAPAERDLITDFWVSQRPDASAPLAGEIAPRGTVEMLTDSGPLQPFLRAFLEAWNPRLTDDAELVWRSWRDKSTRTIAVAFEPLARGVMPDKDEALEAESWTVALRRLGHSLRERRGSLLSYGVVRAVADSAIVIVKLDEKRLWTASAAREDADATAAQIIALQQSA